MTKKPCPGVAGLNHASLRPALIWNTGSAPVTVIRPFMLVAMFCPALLWTSQK
ncbi:hypothetical protein D3C83_162680 [compost metagenome]